MIDGRIALYTARMDWGGIQRVYLTLAADMLKRGVPVDLLIHQPLGRYSACLPDGLNVRILRPGFPGSPALVPLVRYLMEQPSPCHLISADTRANIYSLFAKRLVGKRVHSIVRIDNMYSDMMRRRSFASRQALRYLLAIVHWADAIVAVSQGVADDMKVASQRAAPLVRTIYNPVDMVGIEVSRNQGHSILWPYGDVPVVLGAARLQPQKDFSTLIQAFAKVLDARPAQLIILGDGPELHRLQQLCISLGIADHVTFPGFVVYPYPYMALADVFVVSSAVEGLSQVLLEAMACGTEVVSTDCPSGPSEILEKGRLGELVGVQDPDAMAAAILRAIACPTDPQPRIQRAGDFAPDKVGDRYMALMESLE